jgi:thiol-disulfide isomerase/thioredoxin
MLELGTALPEFSLRDAVSGGTVSTTDVKGLRATLVMFICNHCPFVIHVRGQFAQLAGDYQSQGLGIVAINSNDVGTYPQDGPEHMSELAKEQGWTFPFLLDDTQETAKAFRAACTPDFFLFDAAGRLVYRGQLDGSRPGNDVPVTGKDLRAAIDAVLSRTPVSRNQRPSVGCNIKWRPGNEPPYFA